MENNQEHNLDNFFRNNLENNESFPPEIAWKNIYSQTIGKEKSKPKPLWIYALAATLILLISGFGIWYFTQNEFNNLKSVAGISTNSDSMAGVFTSPSRPNPVTDVPTSPLRQDTRRYSPITNFIVGTNSIRLQRSNPIVNTSARPQYQSEEIDREPLIIDVSDELVPAGSDDFVVSTACYYSLPDLWILYEELVTKCLNINDLSVNIEKNLEKKILPLEQIIPEKSNDNQPDSVVYREGFSLRHPIISLSMGTQWNSWNYKIQNRYFEGIAFTGGRGGSIKIGIAWEINKRLRMGFDFASTRFNLGTPYSTSQIYSSSLGKIPPPDLQLTQVYSDQYYKAKTIVGNVNIPLEKFGDFLTKIPNVPDSTRSIFYKDEQSITTVVFSVTAQYDLISKQRKKGRQFGYQVYNLTDFMVQRQTNYGYRAYDIKTALSSLGNNNFPNIFHDTNHLENASEFVFGLRGGLGFRWQFARKWDFYVEGSLQYNLNSWVKSQDIKTYQETTALQWGLNLNL